MRVPPRRAQRGGYRLCGGAASFFAQVLNEEPKALIHGELFEHLLPAERVVDKRRGHQVGEHFGISKVGKILVDLLGQLATVLFKFGIEIEHFSPSASVSTDDVALDSSGSMRAIGNGALCSNAEKRTRRKPCRIKLEVPSPRPTQARINPMPAI